MNVGRSVKSQICLGREFQRWGGSNREGSVTPGFGAWSWEVESGGWHHMSGDCEMGCGRGAGHW